VLQYEHLGFGCLIFLSEDRLGDNPDA